MPITFTNAGYPVDLIIRRGAAFVRTITYKANGATTNITGYTFAAQVRTVTGTLAATLTCTITNAATGVFQIALTGAETAALTAGTNYLWDLEVTISGATSELLRGNVSVVNEVTQ